MDRADTTMGLSRPSGLIEWCWRRLFRCISRITPPVAEFIVAAGERLAFVLRHQDSCGPGPPPLDAEATLVRTQAFWRDWIGRFRRHAGRAGRTLSAAR